MQFNKDNKLSLLKYSIEWKLPLHLYKWTTALFITILDVVQKDELLLHVNEKDKPLYEKLLHMLS